jgi:hypothetical protein
MAKLKRICSVLGCDKPHVALGYCRKHWARLRRTGSPDCTQHRNKARPTAGYRAVQTWAAEHASYAEADCLIWPFARNVKGYGLIGSAYHTAHRHICFLAHGKEPTPSHEVAHSCGNGHLGCVNPNHLRWATKLENMADKKLHGRASRGSKVHGSRLTEDDVREIRRLGGTMLQREIAAIFNVSSFAVSSVLRRQTWAWLP